MWGFMLGLGKYEVVVGRGSETQLWVPDEGRIVGA